MLMIEALHRVSLTYAAKGTYATAMDSVNSVNEFMGWEQATLDRTADVDF